LALPPPEASFLVAIRWAITNLTQLKKLNVDFRQIDRSIDRTLEQFLQRINRFNLILFGSLRTKSGGGYVPSTTYTQIKQLCSYGPPDASSSTQPHSHVQLNSSCRHKACFRPTPTNVSAAASLILSSVLVAAVLSTDKLPPNIFTFLRFVPARFNSIAQKPYSASALRVAYYLLVVIHHQNLPDCSSWT